MKGFGNIRSFGDMMKQAQKIQRQMTEAQEKLGDERFEASAGGGLVKAIADGNAKIVEIRLDPKALAENDVTLLEDLVLTALSEAQKQAEEYKKETLGGITGGMNLPF
jgi:DNA-binding YbaB/EbfC family protein